MVKVGNFIERYRTIYFKCFEDKISILEKKMYWNYIFMLFYTNRLSEKGLINFGFMCVSFNIQDLLFLIPFKKRENSTAFSPKLLPHNIKLICKIFDFQPRRNMIQLTFVKYWNFFNKCVYIYQNKRN